MSGNKKIFYCNFRPSLIERNNIFRPSLVESLTHTSASDSFAWETGVGCGKSRLQIVINLSSQRSCLSPVWLLMGQTAISLETCWVEPVASLLCFLTEMMVRYYFMLQRDLLSAAQFIIVKTCQNVNWRFRPDQRARDCEINIGFFSKFYNQSVCFVRTYCIVLFTIKSESDWNISN